MFVQESLIVGVPQREVLQELVGQPHQFVHPDIVLLIVGNLQKVQDNGVDADVAQKALFMRTRLVVFDAKLVHSDENLQIDNAFC